MVLRIWFKLLVAAAFFVRVHSFLSMVPTLSAFPTAVRRIRRLLAGDSDAQEYRPISDYCGGWHAGKYDFDPRLSGVTALNFEKSIIYDDDDSNNDLNIAGYRVAQAPTEIPKWATRSVTYDGHVPILKMSQSRSVSITNDEVSWEPFWASLEPTETNCRVSPISGTLAPRGKTDTYSNICQLTVEGEVSHEGTPLYLVVRTEQDHWKWQIED